MSRKRVPPWPTKSNMPLRSRRSERRRKKHSPLFSPAASGSPEYRLDCKSSDAFLLDYGRILWSANATIGLFLPRCKQRHRRVGAQELDRHRQPCPSNAGRGPPVCRAGSRRRLEAAASSCAPWAGCTRPRWSACSCAPDGNRCGPSRWRDRSRRACASSSWRRRDWDSPRARETLGFPCG